MTDVEMNQVGKTTEDTGDYTSKDSSSIASSHFFTGYTKEELLDIEKNEKIWKRIRIGLLIIFWAIWVIMLVAAIIIIILTPKCPPRPNLQPWEKSCIYRVNPFAFKDSDNDNVGDIKGLKDNLDYIVKKFNSKTIIIDQFLDGVFGNVYRFMATSFDEVHPSLGTMEDFKKFIKSSNKQGLQIVLTLDLNGVSVEHKLFKTQRHLFKKASSVEPVGRNGQSTNCLYENVKYYSSLGSANGNCVYVDFDLENNETISELHKVVNFWLNDVGCGGILFTNAAFFVEDLGSKVTTGTGNSNAFFNDIYDGQIYSQKSVDFIAMVKKDIFNKINSVASKKKVLMVEAGDIGMGTPLNTDDKVLEFIKGTEPAADVVLVSEFYNRRGYKGESETNVKISLENYYKVLSNFSMRVAVSMASPFDLKYLNLESLVGNFLTPSLSIIQMGSELNFDYSNIRNNSKDFDSELPSKVFSFDYFPKASRSLTYLYSGTNNNDKDVFNDAMMPWDLNIISKPNYNNLYPTNDNVKLHDAIGAPQSFFSIIKTLSKLRESESLIWGTMNWIVDPVVNSDRRRLIFSRSATGFPAFIVVYISSKIPTSKGEAFSFNNICPKAMLLISYPVISEFVDKEIEMTNVYISTNNDNGEAFYLFKCTSVLL